MKKIFLLLITLLPLLSGCNLRVLDPKSDTAETLSDLIFLSFVIMVVVLIVVMILFVRFLTKYLMKPETEGKIPKDRKEKKWVEITYTILPFVLLAIIAVPTVTATYNLTDRAAEGKKTSEDAMVIDVIGKQFSWNFTYENGKVTTDEVVLPKDQQVVFVLNSTDVIHSFWIPNLAGKMDVRPNKETRLSFTPREFGTYQGTCAEFCGTEHTKMRFTTEVVSPEEFEAWVSEDN
ncbi:cytochrome c oxidase subunit II [Halobacillus massiliensis]|uniref:cytochrome c oxidase subunit II n=1 Tax=Halobacillus massiliensis TaxID=1926286 RepID=UPI0009E41BB0|nr:cytochrome c oxidase subunit II [Halobacillus massiliensis]